MEKEDPIESNARNGIRLCKPATLQPILQPDCCVQVLASPNDRMRVLHLLDRKVGTEMRAFTLGLSDSTVRHMFLSSAALAHYVRTHCLGDRVHLIL